MLDPVAPISSWHQVILALSVLTYPSWNLCSNSANQSDSTCCLWSYIPLWLTMEFIVIVAFDSDSKLFSFLIYLRTAFYFYFTIFLFLNLSYSLCLLEPAIHRLCHHLLEGLFSFYAVVPIFITLLGCARISRHVPRLLYI